MQLPYRMDAKIQVPDSRRGYRESSRREDTSDMRMERCRNTGAQRDERPCAYGGEHSSEGIDIRADGHTERGESDSALFKGKHELKKKPYWGEPFLEPGILCDDSKDGRREDTAICKIPRREQIDRAKELERVWPLLEAIHLQATIFGGGG